MELKMSQTQQSQNLNNSNVAQLITHLDFLTEKVNRLENSVGYQGWMTIKCAAEHVGMSRNALAQRIINHNYPEKKVWRQNAKGASIMVNLKELNKVI